MKHFQMKRAAALFAACIMLAGCNDESSEGNGGNGPEKETVTAFEKQFPHATNVQWSKKKGYDVAAFGIGTRAAAPAAQNSAWYPEGSACCLFTKLDISWEQLRQEAPAVARAWQESPYKTEGYELDGISKKTYSEAAPTYKLEIEQGDSERELVYSAEGLLLSDRPDADTEDDDEEDDPCPQEILQFILTNLPDAQIVENDAERENGITTYKVEVTLLRSDLTVEGELIFSDRFEFLRAVEEIDEEDFTNTDILPAIVYAKLQELAGDNEMDEVYKLYLSVSDFKTGDSPRYSMTVEDEQTDEEITYLVDGDGNLIE